MRHDLRHDLRHVMTHEQAHEQTYMKRSCIVHAARVTALVQ
jgi:hypothetical protein